ncbi:MAG: hypothetical protein QOH83_2116 [Solirubrobacteraceae bacterium]|jgi:hypothetical protein|nr:hypothetical protein [Solirubrobacteraceae bacterium]
MCLAADVAALMAMNERDGIVEQLLKFAANHEDGTLSEANLTTARKCARWLRSQDRHPQTSAGRLDPPGRPGTTFPLRYGPAVQ